MAVFVYRLGVALYVLGIRIAALFQPKAKAWLAGRRGWEAELRHAVQNWPPDVLRIWLHCASLGEYEQGRPLLEALRKNYPDARILLSFFSPSGYEAEQNNTLADYVCYLPADGPRNARLFAGILAPNVAVFVKYEFWYFFLKTLHQRGVPAMLIAGKFHAAQPFFKSYGGLFRRMLRYYHALLLQDEASGKLLAGIGVTDEVQICGDPRYDRVWDIAQAAKALPEIAAFVGDAPALIGGSTWPADEAVLQEIFATLPPDWKMILAPHEIDQPHIRQLLQRFGHDAVLYSQIREAGAQRILIIDNIGLLSSVYRFAQLAFVGGGFAKSGIHNVLEPAVFGVPVLFGPYFRKFTEAADLVNTGFAYPVQDAADAANKLRQIIASATANEKKAALKLWMQQHKGATECVLRILQPLLSNEAGCQLRQ